MRAPWLLLWFLFLLGVGSLPLLLHLGNFMSIRPPRAGLNKQQQLQKVNQSEGQVAAGNSSLTSGSMFGHLLSSSSAADGLGRGSEEELQQQEQQELQELRQRHLSRVCSKYQLGSWQQTVSRWHLPMLYAEDRSRLLYCEVPKVGCSNWKRVLIALSGEEASLLNISHKEAHLSKHLQKLTRFDPQGIDDRLNRYTKVLFVREPFERLVSAFRDKFENHNEYYHSSFGQAIIAKYRTNATSRALRTGDGVTFREFVHYLLDRHRPLGGDIHWEPVGQLCFPCVLRYHFIGKSENMSKEANAFLRHIRAPPHISFPDFKDRNPQDKRTSATIVRKYFSQLNAAERQGVYDLYRLDYLMFDYPKPFPDLH